MSRQKRQVFELEMEVKKAQKELALFKEQQMQVLEAISKRLKINPRVSEVILRELLTSDHEGLQQGLEDLFLQTKLIHPKNICKIQDIIKKEEKDAKEEREYRQACDLRHKQDMENWRYDVKRQEESNLQIRTTNEMKTRVMVEKLIKRMTPDISYDHLSPDEIRFIQAMGLEFPTDRLGFLWHRVKFTGKMPATNKGSRAYDFMMSTGQLTKESEKTFKKPHHPLDYHGHFFSGFLSN